MTADSEFVAPTVLTGATLHSIGLHVGADLSKGIHPIDEPGLEHRFDVYRRRGVVDGQQVLEQVTDCFVLRPGKDEAARAALLAYAQATPHEQLASDLQDWIARIELGYVPGDRVTFEGQPATVTAVSLADTTVYLVLDGEGGVCERAAFASPDQLEHLS